MAGDVLEAFFWRGRWLRVELIEKVERRGSWWELSPGDIYRVKDRDKWILEKVWD